MTFQRKLLLGFSLTTLPVLFLGAVAIRSNALEHRALDALGESMARTRTYAELETSMFNESEAIWRYLSGLDSTARPEYEMAGQVVDFWQQRWRSELQPDEMQLANSVQEVQLRIRAVADSIFTLYDSGQREAAYRMAQRDLRDGLLPALTQLNRAIYRQARESSVRGAYSRLEQILAAEGRVLAGVMVLALSIGLFASWLIARSLSRPIRELRQAMVVVGEGDLDYPIEVTSRDEIGELARAFTRMTTQLRQSRTDMVRLNAELEAKIGQLERTQAQLIQSEKLASIGEMAAAVAHGLRNPLASLRATAQLALHRTDSAPSREHLGLIVQEVDRLDRRISHLLSFSRPAPFRPSEESVRNVVDALLPAFTEPLRERHVDFHVDIPAELPAVRMDPVQLEQALLEIISNALDAMPDGGRLSIAAHQGNTQDGRTEVAIEIADTGSGIPEDVLPSVCDPFFTTRPEGTGLGLAIAKRYIEQNGGRLAIASSRGEGTAITVWLPTSPDDQPPPPAVPPAASMVTPT